MAPYKVTTIVLTVFPLLSFTSPWPFCNYQLVFLNPLPFHPASNPPTILQAFVCSTTFFTDHICFFLSFLLDPHAGCPWVFPSSHTSQPFPQASLGSRAQRASPCQGLPSRSCSSCLRTFLFLSRQYMRCSLPGYMAPQLSQSRLYLPPYPVASFHQLRWNKIWNVESILDAGIGNERAVGRETIS